jgi:2-oxoisovalerate dehydrogenase E1 component alpha subunit
MVDIVARFEIAYYQILNEEGKITKDVPEFAKNPDHLIRLYRVMLLNRIFDLKAIALTRTGKLGTYPSARGQEAVFAGIGDAMEKEDILVPYYRDVGSLIQRGVQLKEILLYWGGDERGNAFECESQDFPYSVPIGTQMLHAAGIATAFQIRGEKRAVLVTCGDGGTSQGDFYEAMNVAGVWKLPIVFVVCNNQWAISVPRSQQTASQTLAQKALAAGFTGEQVDGNDVIAVRERVFEALKNAREKNEPRLLEILSYRQTDHTTADDATRYEPKNQRDAEWKKEPIARLYTYLMNLGVWSKEQDQALNEECASIVEQTVQEYSATPSVSPEVMIDYLYETLPEAYREQRDMLTQIGDRAHG